MSNKPATEQGTEIHSDAIDITGLLQLTIDDARAFEPIPHQAILTNLLDQLCAINFRERAEVLDEKDKVSRAEMVVITIEEILDAARRNSWGLCINHDFIYLYNGAYWRLLDADVLRTFLGKAAEILGIDKFDARHYRYKEELFKQFLSNSNLPSPERRRETVLVNLKNGTYEIDAQRQELRSPNPADFITYQLQFGCEPEATAPMFQQFLDEVLPEVEMQHILAEFLAYLFIPSSYLKLEKTLLLYGSGANGKSVFFEIVNALLGGHENVSCYSLQNLTDSSGYYRAMLANKLVNYASEINGKLQTSFFKQLVSGEPVEARLPYGRPFMLTEYGKLIFNCNELPQDVEQTDAFFRRFLIIPFRVTIPPEKQDKQLARKIIDTELSGVFNWVLNGLDRLLTNKGFTRCSIVENQAQEYRNASNTVHLFLDDENYKPTAECHTTLKLLYPKYRLYCLESGYVPCAKRQFRNRLENAQVITKRIAEGIVVYIKKCSV